MRDEIGFDAWANTYDAATLESFKSNTYPFAGYMNVIDKIYDEIILNSYKCVLDIGFGTAFLTSRLYEKGIKIFGQDFSSEMIKLAKEKMPDANLFKGDFSKGLNDNLLNNKYDAIISTYALHHLKDNEKPNFINNLLSLLNDDGKILIGDVMFKSRNDLENLKNEIGDSFDSSEYYFIIDELKDKFKNFKFKEFSFCSGVIEISK